MKYWKRWKKLFLLFSVVACLGVLVPNSVLAGSPTQLPFRKASENPKQCKNAKDYVTSSVYSYGWKLKWDKGSKLPDYDFYVDYIFAKPDNLKYVCLKDTAWDYLKNKLGHNNAGYDVRDNGNVRFWFGGTNYYFSTERNNFVAAVVMGAYPVQIKNK